MKLELEMQHEIERIEGYRIFESAQKMLESKQDLFSKKEQAVARVFNILNNHL